MGSFDEVHGPDEVRPHYQALMNRLAEIGDAELSDRLGLLDSFFRTLGITFAVTGHEGGLERTWPMDLVPRIIPPDEWSHIEGGLIRGADHQLGVQVRISRDRLSQMAE